MSDRRLEIVRGDLTEEITDAIVNAANSSLLGGGGVDGAIHRKGGPKILEACQKIRTVRGPLPAGEVVETSGGRLAAKHVLHTVGPVWQGGTHGEAETLAACYRNAIEMADTLELKSLSFPSISTGAFGYPVEEAARVALPAVRHALAHARSVVLVRFVLFDDVTHRAYLQAER